MKLNHLDFRTSVFEQSGVSGFYGGYEYPHQKLFRFIPGYSFDGMGFVSKTITTEPRIHPKKSNTPLNGYKLASWLPKSIWVSPHSFMNGYMLNAMGIPNEGTEKFLERLISFEEIFSKPFQISFSPEGSTTAEKVADTKKFCLLFRCALKLLDMEKRLKFLKNCAIQVNLSCPNLGHAQGQDTSEAIAIASVFRDQITDILIILKFDLTVEPESISILKPYCDAFCIGNSLGFGKLKSADWWKNLFPTGISPLVERFGPDFPGGLSGAPLFPILMHWLHRMEEYDPTVIIIAGGGIMTKEDINRLMEFEIVHGIALGVVATLRPWRLQSLIEHANNLFSQKIINNERNYAH